MLSQFHKQTNFDKPSLKEGKRCIIDKFNNSSDDLPLDDESSGFRCHYGWWFEKDQSEIRSKFEEEDREARSEALKEEIWIFRSEEI